MNQARGEQPLTEGQISGKALVYEHATRATIGAREDQEDAAAVHTGPGTTAAAEQVSALAAVLADGMGGHVGGQIASWTACAAFIETFARGEGTLDEGLAAGLARANSEIARRVGEDRTLEGMGCTLVAGAFDKEGVRWISVGDSPLYLYRRGELAALNEDHSLGPELDKLVEAGLMDAEEAASDPRRHLLRSALVGGEVELVDHPRVALPLEPDDVVVLASDGILTLSVEQMLAVISQHAANGAGAIADSLIKAVEDAGAEHQDNTTVVVVRVVDGAAAAA